ncbi:MAG: adenine phosphoribosyltransferase [Nanoarchaeota archaeon]|nr:adenine phosphoribosyltransferase [Nanoarchaeota archaeon]
MNIKNTIRTIPDFPKKGIMFRDITTLLLDPEAFEETIDLLASRIRGKNVNAIVGIESRGFIFGAALAYKLRLKFIPIRKKGKLPGNTISEKYELEYGTDTIEVHDDVISENEKVVLVDDLIATGGTAKAAINLIKKTGAELIDTLFVINLPNLKGIEKLGVNAYWLVEFEGE